MNDTHYALFVFAQICVFLMELGGMPSTGRDAINRAGDSCRSRGWWHPLSDAPGLSTGGGRGRVVVPLFFPLPTLLTHTFLSHTSHHK